MTEHAQSAPAAPPKSRTLAERYLASTRWRLTAIYAVLVALLLVVIMATTYLGARIQETTQIHNQLTTRVAQALAAPSLPHILRQPPVLKDEEEAVRTFIISRDGVVRDADAVVSSPPDAAAVSRVLRENRAVFTTIPGPSGTLSVYTAPIIRHGDVVGAIQAITSVRPYNVILQYLLRVSVVVGSIGLVLAAALAFLMANWGLRPVRRAIASQQVFAQNAAHELRAPLTVVRVAADLALRSGVPEDMREALTTTVRQTEHLDAVVGDLRLLAQGDADRLVVDNSPLNLAALVRDVYAEVQSGATARGIQFELDTPAELTVAGEHYRLRQLLLILIDNALKYTDASGTIAILLSQQHGKAALTIRDTGAGIAPRHMPYIFNRFYRADEAKSGNGGGAGLGLAIAREIVEAHQGHIAAQSEVGKGTAFRITLPVGEVSSK